MTTSRLEAFSDGVFAIIITIMVLELEVPHGARFEDLQPLIPTFLSYLLSFFYVGIYWNNHHHLWQVVNKVNGGILWANLHLLFWLSLFPFTTAWLGDYLFFPNPVATYGIVLFMASAAWFLLAKKVVKEEGKESKIGKAFKKDFKTIESMVIYAVAVALSFYHPIISCIIYAALAIVWVIPDSRIEKHLADKEDG